MGGERDPIVSMLGPSGKLEAFALQEHDDCLTQKIIDIVQKAQTNWLKNEEVLAVLEFFQGKQIEFPEQPAFQPEGGRLFLFSRKKCRGFRNDKHNWRKKNDRKTIKETHEKLKVQDQEKLNCYYAHAERDDGLQRRCYWILDKQFDDVVMVHYLCSSTSRIVGRTTPSKKSQQSEERTSVRPRRAASMRTKFSELFPEDSEEIDNAATSPRRDAEGSSTQMNESHDDLGEPLDSFIAKLPDDFGLSREFSRLDQLPGDLSLSANQIARIIEETTSPSKSPTKIEVDDKYFTLGGSNVSLGRMDLQGLLEGNQLHSPKKGLHGTLSDADSLLRGFSRLESLEFLKMVSPDVSLLNTQGYDSHLGSAGVAFVSKGNDSTDLDKIARSDSYNDNHPSLKLTDERGKTSEKVSTIRRVVAPGTGTGASSGFESSFALQDAGIEKHRKVPNPINRNSQKPASVRMTEAALAASDHNIERRESLLRKVRESKDHARKSEDDDGLIHPPTLFRSQSHLVEAGKLLTIPGYDQEIRDKSPEKAAVLLKQMSIDETSRPTAELLRNLSMDLPPVDENNTEPLVGFGSELLPQKSKD